MFVIAARQKWDIDGANATVVNLESAGRIDVFFNFPRRNQCLNFLVKHSKVNTGASNWMVEALASFSRAAAAHEHFCPQVDFELADKLNLANHA